MKKSNWKIYALFIFIAVAGGALVGFLNSEGTKEFSLYVNKPALTPPAMVFPIAWTILYTMMGISAAMVYTSEGGRDNLFPYWLQLIFNYLWSFLFFGGKAYVMAFILLLLIVFLVIITIFNFRKVNKTAAWLLVPYLLWLIFAGYLNVGVWMLNR